MHFFLLDTTDRQQAKLFEEKMSDVLSGAESAPSGDQINLTFQKMAGMNNFFLIETIQFKCIFNINKMNRSGSYGSAGTR